MVAQSLAADAAPAGSGNAEEWTGHAPGRAIGEPVRTGPFTGKRPLPKSSGWRIAEPSGLAAVRKRVRREVPDRHASKCRASEASLDA